MKTSKGDPFGAEGMPGTAGAKGTLPTARGGEATVIKSARRDATVFDPNYAGQPVKGRKAERTKFAGAAEAGAQPAAANRRTDVLAAYFDSARSARHPSINPYVAAAAPVFVLLGHLQTAPADLDAVIAIRSLADMVEAFDRDISLAGLDEAQTRIASYALCETIDDIMSELPGFSREFWLPQGMLSRFFDTSSAGRGFFAALNALLAAPAGHADLLEFMHGCIALGYKGQYRTHGAAELEQVRRDVYETLRYFAPRPAAELSPQWRGQDVRAHGARKRVPLWAIAGAAAAIVAGAFFELRALVTDEGEAVAAQLTSLGRFKPARIEHVSFTVAAKEPEPAPVVATAPPPPPPPPPRDLQMERLGAALASEISTGAVALGDRGDFIVVRIANDEMFGPGQAKLKPEFQALATSIARALDAEPGPIVVVGHTDSDKPGRGSAFKSNFDLSVARAEAVKKAIAPAIAHPDRISVQGKGEDEPVADNSTPEGRAKNRRVELLIARESPQ